MIGERVRLAREACRLTQQDLAASTGISQATLSEIEAGRVLSPSAETIQGIARATLFPVSFFGQGALPDLPDGHYRKLKRGSSKTDRQLRAQVRQIVELVHRAESRLNLPRVTLEPIRSLTDLAAIEAVATAARNTLGVGGRDPIANVTRAAERAGVVVIRLPNEMPHHDSFSVWPDFAIGGRPIIAITGGHPGDRDRFNICHELGHLLLHTLRSNIDPKQAEQEAHRFAGALLLPRPAAVEAMRPPITLRVLMGIKATFGISMAAAAARARDLSLISRDQYVSILRQLSARKWRHNEPVEVTPERPLLISKVVDILAGQGTTMERAERLSMPLFSFRSLTANS